MQPLTRQELQTALQQLTNNITNQAATKQDLNRAINTINQQSTAQSQSDMQRIFKQYADRILDRAYQEFKLQNGNMQQMSTKIDVVTKKATDYEARMARTENMLAGIQSQLNELMQMQYDSEVRAAASRDDQEERRFAQRTAFGGLFG